MVRGWNPLLPRCGGTPRTPANRRSSSRIGVSKPCGAVSTRRITVFLPDLLELYMYAIISGPGMEYYPSRVRRNLTNPSQSAISQGVGGSTPCEAASTRGITVFLPGLEFDIYGGILTRGWDAILPGWGGTPTKIQPISDQPTG